MTATLTQPIDPTGDPVDDDANCCSECGSVEPCDCFDEPDWTGDLTGWTAEGGPSYE